MKRNIEDYENKLVAIFCSSIEEWDKINDLLGKKGLTRDYGDISDPDNAFVDCIHINGKGTASKKHYEQASYTIYSASDFIQEDPKFEVGKWYKINNNYTKFLILQNKSEIFGSEHIYNNEHHMSEIKSGTWVFKLSDNPVLLTDLSEIQQYLPPNHPDLIVKLTSFPLEGYVYDDVNNLDNLSKYLVNRPFNTPNNNTVKKNAVGIAWNTTSCWWLKTKTSGKTNYKLSDLESFLPKTEIIPEYVKLLPNFDSNNTDRIFYTKGAIPKMENWSYRSWKHLFEIHSTYFKESTKEAFDLQNQSKQLTVDNLIEDEFYYGEYKKDDFAVIKCNTKGAFRGNGFRINVAYLKNNNFAIDRNTIRKATPEEKKWLTTCITQNKFIPKKDLHLYDDNGLLIWEIGCYYKLNFTDSTSTYIKLSKKIDDRIFGNEYTDSTGKWYYSEIIWSTKQLKTHEKVDKPNQKKETMFKKNDYIVVLYNNNSLNSWTNQCFKQLEDLYYLKVVKNLNGNTDGWSVISFENQSKWRYASSAEILEYERIGKPFDVTTLIKKEKSLVKQVEEGLNNSFQYPLTPKESFFTKTEKMIINGLLDRIGQPFKNDINSEDIYIAPIIKKETKIQTITIESTTDLNLNLTKIKSKQIQTIKI